MQVQTKLTVVEDEKAKAAAQEDKQKKDRPIKDLINDDDQSETENDGKEHDSL